METTWTIIVFLYNEQGNVVRALTNVESVMHQIAPGRFEIIVVNDGSTDDSHQRIVDTIEGKSYFKYVPHEVNKGIGSALRTGYNLAKNENVCAVPADCQFNFQELLMCPKFTSTNFVSYYRKRTNYNPYRMFLNHFNRLINYLFLGLKMNDVNWIKVYKLDQLNKLNFEIKSSLIESEICAKLFANNIKCIEIESVYMDRLNDSSKGGALSTVKQAASDLFKLIKVVKTYKRNLRNGNA